MRKGEKIDLDSSGRPRCTAYNGNATEDGMYFIYLTKFLTTQIYILRLKDFENRQQIM